MPDNRDKTIYKLYAWKGHTRRQLRTTGDRGRVEHLMFSPRVRRTLKALGYTEWAIREEPVRHV